MDGSPPFYGEIAEDKFIYLSAIVDPILIGKESFVMHMENMQYVLLVVIKLLKSFFNNKIFLTKK